MGFADGVKGRSGWPVSARSTLSARMRHLSRIIRLLADRCGKAAASPMTKTLSNRRLCSVSVTGAHCFDRSASPATCSNAGAVAPPVQIVTSEEWSRRSEKEPPLGDFGDQRAPVEPHVVGAQRARMAASSAGGAPGSKVAHLR